MTKEKFIKFSKIRESEIKNCFEKKIRASLKIKKKIKKINLTLYIKNINMCNRVST